MDASLMLRLWAFPLDPALVLMTTEILRAPEHMGEAAGTSVWQCKGEHAEVTHTIRRVTHTIRRVTHTIRPAFWEEKLRFSKAIEGRGLDTHSRTPN